MKSLKTLLKMFLVMALVAVGMAQAPVEASEMGCSPSNWSVCEDCTAQFCMQNGPTAYCRCLGHGCNDIVTCEVCDVF